MRKKKGFTLIELLVVISIIALLLSILMPSLQKVKEQARLVVCGSTVRQLGVAAFMYTADNSDSFHVGHMGTCPDPEYQNLWPEAYRQYYEDSELRVCVSAKIPSKDEHGIDSPVLDGDPSLMWGIFTDQESEATKWATAGDYGSYGFNGWLNNPLRELNGEPVIAIQDTWPTVNHFRKMTGATGSTNNIPVFVDSNWVRGYPNHWGAGAAAPEFDGDAGVTTQEMKRYCLNRHGGKVSAAFLDGSARKIGLKELWKLKWHRNFDTNANYYPDAYQWPDWMSGY